MQGAIEGAFAPDACRAIMTLFVDSHVHLTLTTHSLIILHGQQKLLAVCFLCGSETLQDIL